MNPSREQMYAYIQSDNTHADLEACFLSAVELLGTPSSLVDIGCGPGHVVRMAASMGIPAVGVDICATPDGSQLFRSDLRFEWVSPTGPADMVLCLEVGEHLPASSAQVLCSTLAMNTALGGTLLFSAAVPGQGGSGHLNERPHSYWRGLLATKFKEVPHMTAKLRTTWSVVAPRSWWYGQNLMIFRKE